MLKKLKFAQDVFTHSGGQFGGGFNSRILGHAYEYGVRNEMYDYADRAAGWHKADEMVNSGRLFAVNVFNHQFPNGEVCKGTAFPYGGTFVCNQCGNSNLDKEWWKIKVEKNDNGYTVHSLMYEFKAYGETKEEALQTYQAEMLKREFDGLQ